MSLGWKGEAPETRFLTLFFLFHFLLENFLSFVSIVLFTSCSVSNLIQCLFLLYFLCIWRKTPRNQFLFSFEFKLAFENYRQTARSFGCYKVEKEWHQKKNLTAIFEFISRIVSFLSLSLSLFSFSSLSCNTVFLFRDRQGRGRKNS